MLLKWQVPGIEFSWPGKIEVYVNMQRAAGQVKGGSRKGNLIMRLTCCRLKCSAMKSADFVV